MHIKIGSAQSILVNLVASTSSIYVSLIAAVAIKDRNKPYRKLLQTTETVECHNAIQPSNYSSCMNTASTNRNSSFGFFKQSYVE